MITRRAVLAGAGAATVLAACAKEPTAGTRGAPERTYVLVHGAWHGGWCWQRVAEPLRRAGHRVYTPTLTGLGERSHLLSENLTLDTFVADIANVLEWEDLSEVVLVGHSFGGIVVTGLADRIAHRIGHLVYLDAFVLRDGESAFSVLPPEVVATRRKLAREIAGVLCLPVPEASTFGVSDPADLEWVRRKCTPHPLSTYEDPLALKSPPGGGLPVTYIAVRPDFAPTAASRAFARTQAQWAYREIEAGHDAMVTTPTAVVDVLTGL